MSALILVVDDEPDVADLFRQQFRREMRAVALRDGIRAARLRKRWSASSAARERRASF